MGAWEKSGKRRGCSRRTRTQGASPPETPTAHIEQIDGDHNRGLVRSGLVLRRRTLAHPRHRRLDKEPRPPRKDGRAQVRPRHVLLSALANLSLDPLRSRCILISGSLPLAFLSIAPNICHNLPGGVRRDPRMSLSMRDDAWNVKEACPDAAAAHGAHPLRARRARTEEQGDPGSQGAEEQVCTLGLMTAAADV